MNIKAEVEPGSPGQDFPYNEQYLKLFCECGERLSSVLYEFRYTGHHLFLHCNKCKFTVRVGYYNERGRV